jgi:uncharacterized membrane protein
MDTRRAEAFSDGVFAVAITVLVFGLLPIGTGSHVTKALLSAWPQYVAYVVSFLTIGIMWLNHHTLMAQMRRVNRPLLVLNLLLLMGVVAVPFPTALVADHLSGPAAAGGRAATVTYGIVMTAISVAFSVMWLYVGRHASEVGRRTGQPPPRFTSVRFSAGLVGYVAGIVVAVFSPGAALTMYGLIAVYYLFEHLPEPDAEPGADAELGAGTEQGAGAGLGAETDFGAGAGTDPAA